ncbi:MAG: hypothetical protein APF78_09270 [Sphingomonadales bacterium BRH_c3]|nr:MAG: hypothetical protein APF78_09270 [Sphingomonadales bacterium BRH_c3]
MATVEIDFDVYKELTARRATETTTYNDVIRELLEMDAEPELANSGEASSGGLEMKGVFLPNGTQLRVTYKGQTYTAEIKDGAWLGSDGVRRNSPSDAACAITQTNVNGWRFWKVKRPSDTRWQVLNALRP